MEEENQKRRIFEEALSKPGGIELRLDAVPGVISALDLKRELVNRFRELNLQDAKWEDMTSEDMTSKDKNYNFLVVLERSAEAHAWSMNDGDFCNRTARVIIPNDSNGKNPGMALLRRGSIWIEVDHPWDGVDKRVNICVMPIMTPRTTAIKFRELREERLSLGKSKRLEDGEIGFSVKVSCGSFDQDDRFESLHSWRGDTGFENSDRWISDGILFNTISYFEDEWPPKFQVVHLAEWDKWEWMDVYTNNIRGLIFDDSAPQKSQVIYFVVDKPPSFYRRVSKDGAVKIARVMHPSMNLRDCGYDESYSMCDVSRIIQYSRVFKVEYTPRSDGSFNLSNFLHRFSRSQQKAIAFHHPRIVQSGRTCLEIQRSILKNLRTLECLRKYPGCQLALLQLLYNCNISATSTETRVELIRILRSFQGTSAGIQKSPVVLSKSTQHMGTSQMRAVRCLYAALPRDTEEFPTSPIGTLIEPSEAIKKHLTDVDHFSDTGTMPVNFEVIVYPSHVELQHRSMTSTTNSVIDRYRDKVDSFLQVRFADNSGKPLKVEAGIDYDSIIENRVVQVLKSESQVVCLAGQRFEFLGYSMSSLKNRKAVWFFRETDGVNAKSIRDQIGIWTDESPVNKKSFGQKPSTWGSRIALAFTESFPVLGISKYRWDKRADEGQNLNTDGCGLISPALCKEINTALAKWRYKPSRAFQIRMEGVKGVVHSATESLIARHSAPKVELKMLLRKSQIKYEVRASDEASLRIVSAAGSNSTSLFFKGILKAFEDSNAEKGEVLKIYNKAYHSLSRVSLGDGEGLDLLKQIHKVSDGESAWTKRYSLLKLALRLKDASIVPEQYKNSFLALYLAELAEKARDSDLFKIPIPYSHSVLGLTDDYTVLAENEVYIRSGGNTISGKMLVYRYPIIHIGDIQEAEALEDDVLEKRMSASQEDIERYKSLITMDNVIFFSQKDKIPFPNRLAGGDLDGDRFDIITKECPLWGPRYGTSAHYNYLDEGTNTPSATTSPIGDFDIGELAKFIGQYIKNDCFTELQDLHMCLADERNGGMKHPDVIAMTGLLSRAVDYAKSGTGVDMIGEVSSDARFSVSSKPDFLGALNRKPFFDTKGEYHKSDGLLGQIYREIRDVKYVRPENINSVDFHDAVKALRPAPMTEGPFHDSEDQIRDHVIVSTEKGLKKYCNKLEMNGISDETEVYAFIYPKLENFPDGFVVDLMREILRILFKWKVVDADERTFNEAPGLCVKPGEGVDRHMVERAYKTCLFDAW